MAIGISMNEGHSGAGMLALCALELSLHLRQLGGLLLRQVVLFGWVNRKVEKPGFGRALRNNQLPMFVLERLVATVTPEHGPVCL